MTHPGFCGCIKQLRMDRLATQSLKGQRCNKGLGAFGHNNPHICASLTQLAHQFSRFISSDTSGHSYKYFFIG